MALHMVRNIKATRIFKGMPQTVIIQVDRFKGRQFDTTPAKERQLGTPLKVLVEISLIQFPLVNARTQLNNGKIRSLNFVFIGFTWIPGLKPTWTAKKYLLLSINYAGCLIGILIMHY